MILCQDFGISKVLFHPVLLNAKNAGKIFKNEPLVPMDVTSEHEQVQSISKEESRSLLSNDLNLSADLNCNWNPNQR